MNSKFLVYKICDVYFNYYADYEQNEQDYQFIDLVLWYFEKVFTRLSTFPSRELSNRLKELSHHCNEPSKENDCENENAQNYYQKVFDAHNVHANLNEKFQYLNKLYGDENIHCTGFPVEIDKLKRQCKFRIFIVTEKYIESKEFEKDLNDAISLNNNIILLYDQIDKKYLDEIKLSKERIFKISKLFLIEMIVVNESKKNFEDDYIFHDLVKNMNDKKCEESVDKYMLFYYSNFDKERASKIISKIEPGNNFVQYEIKNDISHFTKSSFILIFLSKSFFESQEYKKLIEQARSKTKLFLIVWIDNADFETSLSEFQVINLNDGMEYEDQALAVERLNIFIAKILGFNKPTLELNLKLNSIKMTNSKLLNENYEIIPDDQVIITHLLDDNISHSYQTLVYSIKTGELKTKLNRNMACLIKSLFYWINHLNQILLFDDAISTQGIIKENLVKGTLYEKNGDFVREVNFAIDIPVEASYFDRDMFYFLSFVYNKETNESYLHLRRVDSTHNEYILIYDESFSLKQKIDQLSYKDLTWMNNHMTNQVSLSDFCDYRIHECQEYPYFIFSQQKPGEGILLFSKCSSSILSRTKIPFKLLKIRKNKMIFSDNKGNFFIYNFQVGKKWTEHLFDKYICKLDSLNSHFLKNPVLLPCGNSACHNCIYNHVNSYKGIFKCTFKSCQTVHKLPNRLDKDLVSIEDMKEKSGDILERLIEFGNKITNLPKDSESFEKYFNYLENIIDIRKMSLEDELEKQKEELIEKINNFENFKISKDEGLMSFEFSKVNYKESLILSNIGSFYNEYNREFFTSTDLIESENENLGMTIKRYLREIDI